MAARPPKSATDRHEQPCHVCGSRIRTEVPAGRNSFWCPRCQPKFRSRAVTSR